MSNPVQGWYADPEGSDQLRWWDGAQWSDQFRPAPTGNQTTSDTPSEPAAQVEPPPTGAPVQVPAATKPTAAKPATKPKAQPPASQLITTGILGILIFFFIAGAALAGSAYVDAGDDLKEAQSAYNQAEQKLQEAKDAAK